MELLHNFLLNLENLPPKKLNAGADSAVKISGLSYYSFIKSNRKASSLIDVLEPLAKDAVVASEKARRG